MVAPKLIRGAHALLSGVYRRVAPHRGADGRGTLGLVLPPTRSIPVEGPSGSTPQRRDIRGTGSARVLVLSGRILDRRGQPVVNARIDFRQACPAAPGGILDGHQFSTSSGDYRLTATRPDDNDGAAPLVRVRIEHPGAPTLATALFLPDRTAANPVPPDFHRSLTVSFRERTDEVLHARYDFVLDWI